MDAASTVRSLSVLATGFVLSAGPVPVEAQGDSTVYEIRTYTAHEGRLADMHETFRSYWTPNIFPKHGMESVIYLAPTDTPLARNTMVYILAHESRAAAERSWAAFGADPEVRAIAAQRNANGRIVASVERVYATATDFSPIPATARAPAELVVVPCDSATARGAVDVAAVCRANATWDEANLRMDPDIAEAILDERFFWATPDRLFPKSDVVGIIRDTEVRFEIYDSYDVTVYLSGDMAHTTGISRRRVRLPEPGEQHLVRFTRTFVREGVRWVVLSHHYSAIESR